MQLSRFTAIVALALSALTVHAQPTTDSTEELRALVTQIQSKLSAGQRTAPELAKELEAFDALRAKYRGQKTEAAARIGLMQGSLYAQVLKDQAKAREILEGIKTDFAGTEAAGLAERTLVQHERAALAENAKNALAGKPAPELNFTWSTRDGLKKLSDLKGKVVVIDFWATWCGPCVASFPNVRELTAHYKDLDVVVLGVTSIQGNVHGLNSTPINVKGDPAKEMALMRDYIKAKDITWTVVFSEQEVFNPAYGVTGIPHMVIIAPDGTVRHPDMDPRDPHEQKIAKIDALLKEFGKPVSATAKK